MLVEQKEDVKPICPHCQMELNSLWFRRLSGFLGKRYVYFCPRCKKVLGVTHRKGMLTG